MGACYASEQTIREVDSSRGLEAQTDQEHGRGRLRSRSGVHRGRPSIPELCSLVHLSPLRCHADALFVATSGVVIASLLMNEVFTMSLEIDINVQYINVTGTIKRSWLGAG